MFRKSLTILSGLLAAFFVTTVTHAFEFKQTMTLSLKGGYAQLSGGNGSALVLGNLLYVPQFKIGDDDSLLSLTTFSMNTQQRSVEEDAFFAQSANAMFRPTWRHNFNDSLSGKLRISFLQSANKENSEQSWLDNVYDYTEIAYGAESTWKSALPITFGADWLTRSYPNFENDPLVVAQLNGLNKDTKNFDGVRWKIGTSYKMGNTNLGLRYSGTWKSYGDAYITMGDGQIDLSTKRKDSFNRLGLTANHRLGRDYAMRATVSGTFNTSNETSFDISNNVSLADYYNYNVTEVSLGASWMPFGGKAGHNFSLGYSLNLTDYPGRKVRWADGTYTESTQLDRLHTVSFNGRLAITQNIAVTANSAYKSSGSNQLYQATALSEYKVYNAFGGLEFKL